MLRRLALAEPATTWWVALTAYAINNGTSWMRTAGSVDLPPELFHVVEELSVDDVITHAVPHLLPPRLRLAVAVAFLSAPQARRVNEGLREMHRKLAEHPPGTAVFDAGVASVGDAAEPRLILATLEHLVSHPTAYVGEEAARLLWLTDAKHAKATIAEGRTPVGQRVLQAAPTTELPELLKGLDATPLSPVLIAWLHRLILRDPRLAASAWSCLQRASRST